MTDSGESDGGNKWRSIGTGGLLGGINEIVGVVWKNHTKKEDGKAVEDEDTEEC